MKNKVNRLFENMLSLYLALSIVLTMSSYRYFDFTNILDKALLISVLVIAIFVIFFSKYRLTEFFLLFFLLLFVSIPFLINRDHSILVIVILSIAFTEVASKKTIKKIFILSIIAVVFVLCSFRLGIISQYIMYREGVPRYSLGFYHPNTVGIIFFILLAEYFYLKNEKLRLRHFVVSISMSFFIFYLTNSRTTLIINIILILGILLVKYLNFDKIHRFLYIFIFLPSLCFVISIISTKIFLGSNLVYRINELLSGRIFYGRLFIDLYGIHLFGNPNVKIIGTKQVSESYGASKAMILDNSYLLTLVENGVIPLFFLLLLYTFLIFSVIRNERYYLLIILVSFLCLGLTESFAFNYQYNIFLLYFSAVFFHKEKLNANKMVDYMNAN